MKVNVLNFHVLKNYHISKKNIQKILEDIFDDEMEINIVFLEEEKMVKLNNEFRKKNQVTDVLTFGPYDGIGEIYICPTATENIERMILHGILHLQGFDHEGYFDEKNLKEEMYILQEKYLEKIYDILKNK